MDARGDRNTDLKLTLTAFYGEKPQQLAAFVASIQALVSALVPKGFMPYELPQVHATIVGLEGRRIGGQLLNENFRRLGEARSMDIGGLLGFLRSTTRLPFEARIGGFSREEAYGFDSFGRHPFERSFEIQATNSVVAMGWPLDGSEFTNALDELRREFVRFNVLHKYHASEASVDNDLFFVLGTIDTEAAGPLDRIAISDSIRSEMAAMKPLVVTVDTQSLSLVRYEDPRLPLSSSLRVPLEPDGGPIAALWGRPE
jgi:hypothetical protein